MVHTVPKGRAMPLSLLNSKRTGKVMVEAMSINLSLQQSRYGEKWANSGNPGGYEVGTLFSDGTQ